MVYVLKVEIMYTYYELNTREGSDSPPMPAFIWPEPYMKVNSQQLIHCIRYTYIINDNWLLNDIYISLIL